MFVKASKGIPFTGDPRLYTWYRATSISTGDDQPVSLFSNNDSVGANSTTGYILDKDVTDPDTIYLPLWTRPANARMDNDPTAKYAGGYRDYRFSLYRVSVHTGRATVAQDGLALPGEWVLDGQGNVVARVDQSHSPITDHLKLYRDGSWTDAKDFDATADRGANVTGVTLDGKSLALLAEGSRYTLVRFDIASASVGAPLYANDTYDIAGALHDEWTGRVIGAEYIDDKVQYRYFDPSRDAVQNGIEAVFPGTDAHAVSATLDGSKMIIAVDAPKTPTTYYFLDRATHQATKIASEYPGLDAADLGDMKPYPYKARDGLDIAAYLTLPPGREPKNLPVVVLPHGGPDARDWVHFDWLAQFLANRGYAVLQPNYRGSSGYGRTFTDAGLHQWGLKMQDDITDGTKKLVADGIADPKRVCIVGASYGGYAALAGATFTPDLYACAVSFAGVSNLHNMLVREGARFGDETTSPASFWISRIGDVSADAARIDATSPALHADQVKIPVLLMHGVGDTTVPIEQSEEERDALQKAGKKVEFIQFEGEDHYLNLAETRIRVLTEIERFLKANIGS
jgi:dipeptidyl aminopeptidase/acylaminoacyl peptidase